MKKTVIYDIELNPNLFLLVAFDIVTKEWFIFEISKRKSNLKALLIFLKDIELMIGFNNVRFDYPILHHLVKLFQRNTPLKKLVMLLFQKGQNIIKEDRGQLVKNPFVPQLDLLLINHYDNFAKSTSLKILEFNMRMENIQTLPFSVGKYLTNDEIDDVINYCKNDVTATYKFFLENKKSIAFREKMSKIHKYDFTNDNDVKIGELILLKAISKASDMSEYEVKKLRTFRTAMNMSDIILPYIKFKSKELNILLNWWKDKIIFETKGQFNKLDLNDVQELLPYCNNELEKGKLKNLNIIVNDFQFDFGTGGLHGTCHPGVFNTDDKNEIILIDVSSYYPNLAGKNRFHPAHIDVDVFVNTIDMLYGQRMKAKDEGDEESVKGIKLALNGALYGKSNSPYSFMYDPQFMMSICVNGQLLLASIAEDCMIEDMKVIQVNTDGVMVLCPKNKRHILDTIVKKWEELTKLKLDYDFFQKIVQRDVNNYLGVYNNGKIKYKGVFDYDYTKNGDWHKNFSMLIVAKALEAYFLKGIQPEKFITEHQDFHDFFKRTKFDKRTKLVQRVYNKEGDIIKQELLQNITRYYVSTKGYNFVKIMQPLKGQEKDREFVIESGYKCEEMNHITNEKVTQMRLNLDYNYYITKVKENIAVIEDYLSFKDLTFDIIDDTE